MGKVLLALLFLTGCACENSKTPDALVMGHSIWWGPQKDRRFEEVVKHCQADLGVEFEYGARITFYPFKPEYKAAGWYFPDSGGVIHVIAHECLDATSLCHEMLHMHLDYHRGDPDYKHTSGLWAKLPGPKYCPVSS